VIAAAIIGGVSFVSTLTTSALSCPKTLCDTDVPNRVASRFRYVEYEEWKYTCVPIAHIASSTKSEVATCRKAPLRRVVAKSNSPQNTPLSSMAAT
jgi:hypothetical protein